MESTRDDFCAAAEETFEQLSSTMHLMALVYEESVVAATDHLRALTELYQLTPELADDAVNEAEEEQCLRRSIRCYMTETLLGRSVASWSAHKHVARVIAHKDGSYTVFARMFPRLTGWEVKRLSRDLKTFLPEGTSLKLNAVWEKRKKR